MALSSGMLNERTFVQHCIASMSVAVVGADTVCCMPISKVHSVAAGIGAEAADVPPCEEVV